MKKIQAINKSFKLSAYEFKDLSEQAKNKVFDEYITFWLEVTPYEEMNGNFKKAVDRANQLQTPWFTGSYVYDFCKDEIIEEIELNHYLFDKDGNLLPVTYHTDKNKIVKTTFQFFGNKIEVKPIFKN